MKNYIFLTTEGYTFQPSTNSIEPDIENAQVIGFSSGLNEEDAFKTLLETNEYLLETEFNEIFCYPLEDNYSKSKKCFF